MFTRMMAQGIVTIIYTLEFAGLLVAALPRYKQKYYVPVKMLCSVSFVVIAVMFAFISDHMQYFYMMLVPLVLCAVGDLFMGLYQIRSRRKHMLAGMIVFLLAHMGFLICFFRIDARLTWWNIFLPVVSLASAHGKTGDSGSDILRLSVAHAIQEHTIYGTLPGTCFRLDRLWRDRLFYLRFYDHLFVLLQVP